MSSYADDATDLGDAFATGSTVLYRADDPLLRQAWNIVAVNPGGRVKGHYIVFQGEVIPFGGKS